MTPGGLGLCLVASNPKSCPKLNAVERLALALPVVVAEGLPAQSSLKKLAIEFVGDWLRLEEGDTDSAVLPREKVGLRFSGLGRVPMATEFVW